MKKLLVILTMVVMVSTTFTSCGYMNEQHITDTVLDKERVHDAQNGSYYLVFCENNTFKISDQMFFGNFNSSDLYGRIRRDSTYKFKVHGYRVGFFSMYPIIENYSLVNAKK